MALVVLGLAGVALIGAFNTVIGASSEHRTLSTNDVVLKDFADSATYQIQLQQPAPTNLPYFLPCATFSGTATNSSPSMTYSSSAGSHVINFTPPLGYSVQVTQVQYLVGNTTFQTSSETPSCLAQYWPQLITATATGPKGSASLSFVVSDPQHESYVQPTAPVTPVAQTVSFSNGSGGATATDTVFLPDTTYVASATGSGGGTITYSTSSAGCSVGPSSGAVTFTSPGSCVIHAAAAANGNYAASTTDATLTITVSRAIHVNSMVGGTDGTRTGWDALVTIHVVDGYGTSVAGVTVSGSWGSSVSTSTSSCTTGASGSCQVEDGVSNRLHSSTSSETFTVTSLALTGYTYNSSANLPNPAVAVVPQP
jgi:hypothetical protein